MRLSPLKDPTRGLWWAALLVGLVGASTFWGIQRAAEEHRLVSHTNVVLYHLEMLMSALKDAETGQRGFIITGREDFLQPYHAAQESVPHEFETLRSLTRDNPIQQRRLEKLRPIVFGRFGVLEANLNLARAGKLSSAQQAIRQGNGKRMMDQIRQRIRTMETDERTLLSERSAAAATTSFLAGIIAVGGAVVLFALVVYNTGYIRRDIQRRIDLERSLRQSEQRLSITLHSIGDAVMAVDAHGLITLMNPFAQMVSGWTEEGALGRDHKEVFRIVNEDTRQTVESPLDQVLRTRKTIILATHTILLRRDGGEVPIEDSAAPIFDADGALLGAILVFRDISQRKDLELAIQREADLARSMQMAALPKTTPTPPGLDIAARCEFATDVGGDFYLFLPSQRGINFVLGDVSGKGTPAALAATSIAHLLPWLRPSDDPLATLRKLNLDLLERLPDNSFATLVLVEADSTANTIRIWSAGHPAALMWSATGGAVRSAVIQNPLLGVLPDWNGDSETWPFTEGDILVLYSDGLSETRNESGVMFEDEIPLVLARWAASKPQEIAEALMTAAEAWGPKTDDLTLLVCKRVPFAD